jgi:hypothetical protein
MRILAGIILHIAFTAALMYATTLSALASFVIAGICVWLGILVVSVDIFD